MEDIILTIDDINCQINELHRKKRKLTQAKEELIKKNIVDKYGRFLYCIEISSPGASRGGLNYIDFTETHGCFSTKEKALAISKKYNNFREGPRTYYSSVRVKEIDDFSISELNSIDKQPYIDYSW